MRRRFVVDVGSVKAEASGRVWTEPGHEKKEEGETRQEEKREGRGERTNGQ